MVVGLELPSSALFSLSTPVLADGNQWLTHLNAKWKFSTTGLVMGEHMASRKSLILFQGL